MGTTTAPARSTAVVDDGELGHVGQHDRDPVARLDAAVAQQSGHASALLVQVAVGQDRVVEPYGRTVRKELRTADEVVGQVHRTLLDGDGAYDAGRLLHEESRRHAAIEPCAGVHNPAPADCARALNRLRGRRLHDWPIRTAAAGGRRDRRTSTRSGRRPRHRADRADPRHGVVLPRGWRRPDRGPAGLGARQPQAHPEPVRGTPDAGTRAAQGHRSAPGRTGRAARRDPARVPDRREVSLGGDHGRGRRLQHDVRQRFSTRRPTCGSSSTSSPAR